MDPNRSKEMKERKPIPAKRKLQAGENEYGSVNLENESKPEEHSSLQSSDGAVAKPFRICNKINSECVESSDFDKNQVPSACKKDDELKNTSCPPQRYTWHSPDVSTSIDSSLPFQEHHDVRSSASVERNEEVETKPTPDSMDFMDVEADHSLHASLLSLNPQPSILDQEEMVHSLGLCEEEIVTYGIPHQSFELAGRESDFLSLKSVAALQLLEHHDVRSSASVERNEEVETKPTPDSMDFMDVEADHSYAERVAEQESLDVDSDDNDILDTSFQPEDGDDDDEEVNQENEENGSVKRKTDHRCDVTSVDDVETSLLTPWCPKEKSENDGIKKEAIKLNANPVSGEEESTRKAAVVANFQFQNGNPEPVQGDENNAKENLRRSTDPPSPQPSPYHGIDESTIEEKSENDGIKKEAIKLNANPVPVEEESTRKAAVVANFQLQSENPEPVQGDENNAKENLQRSTDPPSPQPSPYHGIDESTIGEKSESDGIKKEAIKLNANPVSGEEERTRKAAVVANFQFQNENPEQGQGDENSAKENLQRSTDPPSPQPSPYHGIDESTIGEVFKYEQALKSYLEQLSSPSIFFPRIQRIAAPRKNEEFWASLLKNCVKVFSEPSPGIGGFPPIRDKNKQWYVGASPPRSVRGSTNCYSLPKLNDCNVDKVATFYQKIVINERPYEPVSYDYTKLNLETTQPDNENASKAENGGNVKKDENDGNASKDENDGNASKAENGGNVKKDENDGNASKDENGGNAKKAENGGNVNKSEPPSQPPNDADFKRPIASRNERQKISAISQCGLDWIFSPQAHGVTSAFGGYQQLECYVLARFPENQNPLVSLSLQRKLDEKSPREYLTAVLHDLSLEERDSLMVDEKQRRKTFLVNWPHDGNLSGEKMAQAGFYCVDDYDRVQCVFCRGSLHKWDPEDIPMTEHARSFPFCRFIKGLDCGNREYKNDVLPVDDLKNITYLCHPDMKKNRDGTISTNSSAFGISTNKAQMIRYAPYETRKATFAKWPTANKIGPEKLIEAGFYYIGFDDTVRCFYCAGSLREWAKDDDPWMEHARWFPDCSYLVQLKGEIYIEHIHAITPEGKKCSRQTELEKKTEKEYKQRVSVQQAMEDLCLKLGHEKEVIDEVMLLNDGIPYDKPRDMIEMLYKVEERQLPASDRMESGYESLPVKMKEAPFVAIAREDLARALDQVDKGATMVDAMPDVKVPAATCHTCYRKTSQPVPAIYIGLPCGHLIYCESCKADERKKCDNSASYKSKCASRGCQTVLSGLFRSYVN